MDSILRSLHDVIDLKETDDGSQRLTKDGGTAQLLKEQQERYDELLAESTRMESRLFRTEAALAASKEVWLRTHAAQEDLIQVLLHGGAPTVLDEQTGVEMMHADMRVYVSSLKEQIEGLRHGLQAALEEQHIEALQKQDATVKDLAAASSVPEVQEQYNVAVKKLQDLWDNEREELNTRISKLERSCRKQAESMLLLGEKKLAPNEPTTREHELENQVVALQHDIAELKKHTDATASPKMAAETSSADSASDAPDSEPTLTKDEVDTLRKERDSLRIEVMQLHHESDAREEALASLYEDSRRFQAREKEQEEELFRLREAHARLTREAERLRMSLTEEEDRSAMLSTSVEKLKSQNLHFQQELAHADEAVRRAAQGVDVANLRQQQQQQQQHATGLVQTRSLSVPKSGTDEVDGAASPSQAFLRHASQRLKNVAPEVSTKRKLVAIIFIFVVMAFFIASVASSGGQRDVELQLSSLQILLADCRKKINM